MTPCSFLRLITDSMTELEDIVQVSASSTLTRIDAALRNFVMFSATYHGTSAFTHILINKINVISRAISPNAGSARTRLFYTFGFGNFQFPFRATFLSRDHRRSFQHGSARSAYPPPCPSALWSTPYLLFPFSKKVVRVDSIAYGSHPPHRHRL